MPDIFKPLTRKPRELADYAADEIDPLEGDRGYVRPFIAGSLQGAGDMASDMTSPFSLLTMALGAGGLRAASSIGKTAKRSGLLRGYGDDLGKIYERFPEFAPNDAGARNAINAARQSRVNAMKSSVKNMSEEGSRLTSRRATGVDPSDEELVKFMQAVAKARGK